MISGLNHINCLRAKNQRRLSLIEVYADDGRIKEVREIAEKKESTRKESTIRKGSVSERILRFSGFDRNIDTFMEEEQAEAAVADVFNIVGNTLVLTLEGETRSGNKPDEITVNILLDTVENRARSVREIALEYISSSISEDSAAF